MPNEGKPETGAHQEGTLGIYLRECLIENVGPIRSFDLSLRFNADGSPKPLLLIGPNGSGKTVLLAHIVDALTELAKKAFDDAVLPTSKPGTPYFKITGGTNLRSGASFGHCLLEFSGGKRSFGYGEHVGRMPTGHSERLRGRFTAITPANQESAKRTTGTKNDAERFFQESAVCFFPSSRHEKPHWFNPASVSDVPVYGFEDRYTGQLGKPLVIESAGDATIQWLMDVILDSRAEINVKVVEQFGMEPCFLADVTDSPAEKLALKTCKSNADRILQLIIQDHGATFVANSRNRAHERLSILRSDSISIPSLRHLSAGQSILLNCFATILRYSERAGLDKSMFLDRIEGIVLIDEIDAHLHTTLQYEVLPALCKLLPRVQFIITSHSPLFLLGMEVNYGSDGIQLIEAPDGHPITTERFAEFRRSFDCYRQTKLFEESVTQEVKDQLKAGTKPLVLTEGKIDSQYLRTALDLLGRGDLLDQLDIECVGTAGVPNSSGSGSGSGSLDAAFSFLRDNPRFQTRPVMLLYDHDVNKKPTDGSRLTVRSIPRCSGHTKMKKGVENLFPDDLFEDEALTKPFIRERERTTDYLVSSTIREFDKQGFCDWMCNTRRNKNDFVEFKPLITILDDFLATINAQ